jgi:hypothetical protein
MVTAWQGMADYCTKQQYRTKPATPQDSIGRIRASGAEAATWRLPRARGGRHDPVRQRDTHRQATGLRAGRREDAGLPNRQQLDIGYAVVHETVDMVEIRPDWQNKSTTMRTPVVRVKFVRTQMQRLLQWMQRDLYSLAHESNHVHSTLRSALKTEDTGAHSCCFE